jgi:DNA-binding NarL/FixJ family response regulator
METESANPADGSESTTASDPVDMISSLLEPDYPPTRKPERPEPGPEDPPEEPDEEEEQEAAVQPEEEPETFVVKIDGKEARVTREELLNGYQRQADYSRKTAAIAEEKRQAQELAQSVHAERQHYSQQLEQVALVLQQNLPAMPPEHMLQTDLAGYVQQKELYENRVRQLRSVLAEKQQADEQTAREWHQRQQQMMASAREQLLAELPEWKNPEKARTGQREVADHLRTIGYTEAEIAQAADPRAVVMARESMLYRRLVASQPKVNQKLATAPKMVKPGSAGPAPDQAKALTAKVQRSGGKDMDAIARLIELG